MIFKNGKDRFWEIDLLRGFAIILMIFFHLLYDLNFYSITNFQIRSGIILYIGRLSALLFIFIAGISLSISYSRVKNQLNKKNIIIKFLKRGLKIFLLGSIITIITWIYIPNAFIIFGVLHFIGISIILSLMFIKFKFFNIIFGFITIIIGIYFNSLSIGFNFLIPIGLKPSNFWTLDYFPLFPWFGVILFGIALGNFLYPDFKRKFKIKDRSRDFVIKSFCFLGRNSLLLYFLHQPIIILLIMIFKIS